MDQQTTSKHYASYLHFLKVQLVIIAVLDRVVGEGEWEKITDFVFLIDALTQLIKI